jgi:hypothetical protein
MADNEDNNLLPQGGARNPNPQMVNANEFKTIFSNPKADIPVYFEKITEDSLRTKCMYDQILFAQTTYQLSDAATVGNFKLALSECVIDWLNYIKDTENVEVTIVVQDRTPFHISL